MISAATYRASRTVAELEHWRRFRTAARERFPDRIEPVLSALLGTILGDTPTACALVGLRSEAQARAAAAADTQLNERERQFVREAVKRAEVADPGSG